MIYYTSDTHFGHDNIRAYCRRPFPSVQAMDAALREAWAALFPIGTPHRLVHGGDFSFGFQHPHLADFFAAGLPNRAANVLVLGNHDHGATKGRTRACYERFFGQLVGVRTTWRTHGYVLDDEAAGRRYRVLVSHQPQRPETWPPGVQLNLYGHVHNNLVEPSLEQRSYWEHHPEHDDRWVLTSPRHYNLCVELTGYRPVTLAELLASRGGP